MCDPPNVRFNKKDRVLCYLCRVPITDAWSAKGKDGRTVLALCESCFRSREVATIREI
jgi:hypothetical protein